MSRLIPGPTKTTAGQRPLWLAEAKNARTLGAMHIRRGARVTWDVRPYQPDLRQVDTDPEWTCRTCLDTLPPAPS